MTVDYNSLPEVLTHSIIRDSWNTHAHIHIHREREKKTTSNVSITAVIIINTQKQCFTNSELCCHFNTSYSCHDFLEVFFNMLMMYSFEGSSPFSNFHASSLSSSTIKISGFLLSWFHFLLADIFICCSEFKALIALCRACLALVSLFADNFFSRLLLSSCILSLWMAEVTASLTILRLVTDSGVLLYRRIKLVFIMLLMPKLINTFPTLRLQPRQHTHTLKQRMQ